MTSVESWVSRHVAEPLRATAETDAPGRASSPSAAAPLIVVNWRP